MRKLRILLVGQPNVGKSSLLNALVGPKVIVSNYPGTTVEVTKAEKTFDQTKITFEDTPGIYSISGKSEEEKVTERALLEEDVDGVIIVADATALERSLYIVLQVLEAEIPSIIALNFVEEAQKKGIKIDCEKLEKILNVPVVRINPLTRTGITELLNLLPKIKKRRKLFQVEYDDHIEKAIKELSNHVKMIKLPKRFVALRILEGDEYFYKNLRKKETLREVQESLSGTHPKVAEDICVTRYGTASFIAEKVTQIVPLEKGKSLQQTVDDILLHKVWGPAVTGLSLLFIFGLLLYLGSLIQGYFMNLTDAFISSFKVENSILGIILVDSLTGLAAGISIALPYVFLFYLFLGILEDVGVLSRFIVNLHRFLRKVGLPDKSFIPLALGLGCTVPAITATRVLSDKKEQFYTATFFSFVPCSSRMAIIMGIVGFYGNIFLAISVFLTLLTAGLIWAFVMKNLVHIKAEPLLLELPPYRKPLIENVLAKSWIRMKYFIYLVVPLLILGGIILGILEAMNLTNMVVEPFSPITSWLGLPPAIIIPLFFGFLQKDLTGGMLASVLEGKISSTLTSLQLYTFGVIAVTGIPCINALGMFIKEFGFKKAISLTIISIVYAVLFAGLTYRIASIFGC